MDQVNKGARRIPWHYQKTKDATGCDKPRGAVKVALIRGFPMGQPVPIKIGTSWATGIKTGGTETSKYLEEKKQVCIPKVVASEMGEA